MTECQEKIFNQLVESDMIVWKNVKAEEVKGYVSGLLAFITAFIEEKGLKPYEKDVPHNLIAYIDIQDDYIVFKARLE